MNRDEEQRIRDINSSEKDLRKSKVLWDEYIEDLEDEAFMKECHDKWNEENRKYLEERDKLIQMFNDACQARQEEVANKYKEIISNFCREKKR